MSDPRRPVRYLLDLADVTILDPIAAHLCGWASYYAYYSDAADYFMSILGASDVNRIPADVTTGRPQGWVLTLSECNIVVFSGTTDYSQLYGVLRDTFMSTLPNVAGTAVAGSVWAGHVWSIYSSYSASLLTLMQAKKTLFCGHSMGGAIAASLLASLRASGTGGLQPSNAYTFGCPRLGNRNLRLTTPDQFNIVIAGDAVPKLPHLGYFRPLLASGDPHLRAVWPTDGFTKHGKLTYLGDDGALTVVAPGELSDPKDVGLEVDAARAFSNALAAKSDKAAFDTFTAPFERAIRVHQMQQYLDRLEKNLPSVPTEDGFAIVEEGETLEKKLPPVVLSTVERITPPAFPTPPATEGVRPLTARRRH